MSEANDQPNDSEQELHQPMPSQPSKRARINTSKQNAPKKRVKGKQGGLQIIMKMPIEVFLEIAPHVDPGDLITLTRTSKFFRALLLARSAAPIWQRSLSSVLDLPPCPTGMTEPQYSALIFSKNCTNCGVYATTSKPDPYLRVRLCPVCRITELEETSPLINLLLENFLPFTLRIKRNKDSLFKNPAFQLRAQTEEFDRMKGEFIHNGDMEGLAKWKQQKKVAWDIQRKEGNELLKYIDSAAASRSRELEDSKTERREQIYERLRAVGWDDKYLDFEMGNDTSKKQWRDLVEVAKPLTERVWKNILPKLTNLLEANRSQIDEDERNERACERRIKTQDLLREFTRNTDPYRPISKALQLPSKLGGLMHEMDKHVVLEAPFPSLRMISAWDFLTGLYREENSLERVVELFDEQQGTLSQKLIDWRTEVENQLVKQYTSSFAGGTSSLSKTVLTINGSTEITRDLSENSRFLLRADTVFVDSNEGTCHTEADQEHGPIGRTIYFPNMSPIQNHPHLLDINVEVDLYQEATVLRPYVRHAGKEAITKALLRELDMPNAAYIELQKMGQVFVCGRCPRIGRMIWRTLVEHYHGRIRNWVGGTLEPKIFTTKHAVVVRDIHALETTMSAQPLVRVEDDTFSLAAAPVARCLICHWIPSFVLCRFDSMESMEKHMTEVHNEPEPGEGLHFMTESDFSAEFPNPRSMIHHRLKWENKWDEHHNSRGVAGEKTNA